MLWKCELNRNNYYGRPNHIWLMIILSIIIGRIWMTRACNTHSKISFHETLAQFCFFIWVLLLMKYLRSLDKFYTLFHFFLLNIKNATTQSNFVLSGLFFVFEWSFFYPQYEKCKTFWIFLTRGPFSLSASLISACRVLTKRLKERDKRFFHA